MTFTGPDAARETMDRIGDLDLSDDACPALPGLYEVAVTHQVSNLPGDPWEFSADPQQFEIRAPQFQIDSAFIHTVHPPAGAAGDFADQLAHITLRHHVLPWERALEADDTTRTPWVALLLLDASDITEADGVSATSTGKVESLLTSTDPQLLLPALDVTSLPADVRASTCEVVDVPAPVFTVLAPRREELRYLAHVRHPHDASGQTDVSVVCTNRFPQDASTYTACLVSLEGHAGHLPPAVLDPARRVRLVVLHSWSFASRPVEGGNFATVVANLAASAGPLRPHVHWPRTGNTAAVARERVNAGFVPCTFQLSSGERTTAWYRGPLTAEPAQQVPPADRRFTHADEALIYLKDQGMFDISYATAFTGGVLYALAHAELSAVTLAARGHARNLALRLHTLAADGPHRAPGSTAALQLGAARGLREALRPGRLRRTMEALLADGLADRLTTAYTAPRTPSAPPADHLGTQAAAAAPSLVERVAVLLADPHIREAFQDVLGELVSDRVPGPDRRGVPRWVPDHLIATADRLARVPFDHLVPHAGSTLPPESLRFFYLDPAWLRAVDDGAFSTGLHTRLDAVLDPMVRRALTSPIRTGATKPTTGMLIRSVLTAHWPDVIIDARAKDGSIVWSYRRDAMAPGTTVVLFEGIPHTVTLREPAHGLQLGLDARLKINLRRLVADSTGGIGKVMENEVFPAHGDIRNFFRPAPMERTASVVTWMHTSGKASSGLVPEMTTALRHAGQLGPQESLTPAGLALQLLNTPCLQPFSPEGSA